MKQFFTWLVLRAFKIKEYKEPVTKFGFIESNPLHRKRRRQTSVVNLFALSGSLLMLTSFLYPTLKGDHSLSNTYNSSDIINTIGASSLSAGILLFFVVFGITKVSEHRKKSELKKKMMLQNKKNKKVDYKN